MTQAKVMRQYFDVYYPAAMKTAALLRNTGDDRYTWTTGSWLLYEYLEQATALQRKEMEQAIAAGDITWHALPFSWQTEMLDRSMIAGALGFSADLDRRFGHKTIAAKMSDVPGHSRGIIAPLEAAGVRLLDIGVNGGSTTPDLPEVFLWKDSAAHSLAMIYHHDYGSTLQIPGSDIAVSVEVRTDNSGPHTLAEIASMHAKLRIRYPGAIVQASNLNEVAVAVDGVRDTLPIVTKEIGDTWIYGVASDPPKIARYREVARLRKQWIAAHRFAAGDDVDRQVLRRLLLAVEHTWGTDTKTYLDNDHYRPKDLLEALGKPGYVVSEGSWQEKRDDIDLAVAALPEILKEEAMLRLADLQPKLPSTVGLTHHDPKLPITTAHYTLGLDPSTGAITRLLNRATRREWASMQNPLALFTYQTLSASDYVAYRERYVTLEGWWVPLDFGKPNIETFHAAAQEWHPQLIDCWTSSGSTEDRVLLHLQIKDAGAVALGNVAWPRDLYLDLRMPRSEARIDLQFLTFGKQANRLPEAMWLTFKPIAPDPGGWTLTKVDEQVAPADVVRGGGRSMHALSDGLRYHEAQGHSLDIQAHDSPVVALGERSPLNFAFAQPRLADGVHFSLFNNAWGTNYLMWNSGDWSSRFTLIG